MVETTQSVERNSSHFSYWTAFIIYNIITVKVGTGRVDTMCTLVECVQINGTTLETSYDNVNLQRRTSSTIGLSTVDHRCRRTAGRRIGLGPSRSVETQRASGDGQSLWYQTIAAGTYCIYDGNQRHFAFVVLPNLFGRT